MDKYLLKLRQALPLEEKIKLTNKKIYEWYTYFNGAVAMSAIHSSSVGSPG